MLLDRQCYFTAKVLQGCSTHIFRTYTGSHEKKFMARLAQSAERKALNLVVVGSSPTVGVSCSFRSFATCSRRKHGHAGRTRVIHKRSYWRNLSGQWPNLSGNRLHL